jgi:hypothetical protein
MLDEIDYVAIADDVFAALSSPQQEGKERRTEHHRLTLDQIDAILQQRGLAPVPSGRAGRNDWNQERAAHRRQINVWLAEKHAVTLEVVGRLTGNRPLYGLVTVSDRVVAKPFHLGESFYRGITRHLNAIAKLMAPPPGLTTEQVQTWHKLNKRKMEGIVALYFDELELNTMRAGLADHIPVLDPKIVRLREVREQRSAKRAGKKKAEPKAS